MSMIGDWFRRLLGRPESEPPPPPVRPKPRQPRRAATPAELSIDEAPPRAAPKAGGAGFDPYSSDAGYQKPHSWERVDHD